MKWKYKPHLPGKDSNSGREKWHREVQKFNELRQYIAEGQRPLSTSCIKIVRLSTTNVLSGISASEQRDLVLLELIGEHAKKSPKTWHIAVLCCLPAFTSTTAFEQLLLLKDLYIERYLRCIIISLQLETSIVVSETEIRVLRVLLKLLDTQQGDIDNFRQLIEALQAQQKVNLITSDIILTAVEKSGIGPRIERIVLELLEKRHLVTLHQETSWLQNIDLTNNGVEIVPLLDKYFPSWSSLWSWRPNIERISGWEKGNWTKTQCSKLERLFDLDGPDTAGHKQESLRLSEPACFKYINVQPRTTATLERLIELLSRAQRIGDGAIELFVQICVDQSFDSAAMELVEACIATGENAGCHAILVLFQISRNSNLDRSINSLISVFPDLKTTITEGNVVYSPRNIATITTNLYQQAQEKFCEQLAKGLTGEYMGLLISELGSVIYQATWIHKHLSSGILHQLSRLPSRDVLEAIFHQSPGTFGSSDFRFKSYLECSLGGKGVFGGESVDLVTIEEEIQFWRRRPNPVRQDLAKILAKIDSLEYSWYTRCLTVMLRETDLYMEELRHIIQLDSHDTVQTYAKYLRKRRDLTQLQDDCWLMLFAALIQEQGNDYLETVARKMNIEQWKAHLSNIRQFIQPARVILPEFGTGLSRQQLSWWDIIEQKETAVNFLLTDRTARGSFVWIYFPFNQPRVANLLDLLNDENCLTHINQDIVSQLAPNCGNVVSVVDCLIYAQAASGLARRVFEIMFARRRQGWPDEGLSILVNLWPGVSRISNEDVVAFEAFQTLLLWHDPRQPNLTLLKSTGERLVASYNQLIGRARKLDSLRIRLHHHEPERTASILNRVGVTNTGARRVLNDYLDDDLIDAVETIGDSEYEIGFPLTDLKEVQCLARGIPHDARMLVIRLRLQERPVGTSLQASFCIHFSPQDDTETQHLYHDSATTEPTTRMCNATLTFFTFYIARNLYRLFQRRSTGGRAILRSVYSRVQDLINKSPQTCIACSRTTATRLWRPAACSPNCSLNLRVAPLEVRLHNLLVDPLSIDLILTSIYAAAIETAPIDLLPGCPVARAQLRAVIDSFPHLNTLKNAHDLSSAIRGSSSDGYGEDRERLLSWLCLKFRGFMIEAPSGFRVPSMPQTKQFVLLNSHHEHEAAFQAQMGSQLSSGVVFHGTTLSRLFSILTSGLKVMSHRAALHGAAYGSGIYLGDDQTTSFSFAKPTGTSWRHSSLSNMRVMLGCELAAYTQSSHGTIHVVQDMNRVIVRYVFLLPANYQCPPRHHVEPAMQAAYAMLRSGIND
jgi:poly(ADP-ribose) polymerase-like protein